MNRRQIEIEKQFLASEKAVLKNLEQNYINALADIKRNIKLLQANPLTQSKIYQVEYQKMLEKQLTGVLNKLQSKNFTSISEYLKQSYTDGFVGSMYDMQGQGVPLVLPIDENRVIHAVARTGDDYKLTDKLGTNTALLKRHVHDEVSRGFSTQMPYADIARNISFRGESGFKRSLLIARTEGHRIQNEAKVDAMNRAVEHGAEIVKQWDSTLDGKTRPRHQKLDGQIRELDEPFEVDGKSAMMPGAFGDPAEDCNCRCCILQRARWAVKAETSYQKWNNEAGGFVECTGYSDFKEKYLEIAKSLPTTQKNDIINNTYKSLTKKQYDKLVASQEIDYFDTLKLKNRKTGYIGTGNSFDINSTLRKGNKLTKSQEETASLLSHNIGKYTTSENLLIDRYVDEEWLASVFNVSDIKDLSGGATYTEKGYVSASLFSGNNLFKDYPIKIQIQAPKGTHMYITDNVIESETILGTNCKFELVSTGKKDGQIKILLKLIEDGVLL